MERYSVFTSTQAGGPSTLFEKQYDGFGKNGYQFGLLLNFNFVRFFTLSFQPAYTSERFSYRNQYQWTGQGNNALELNQTHRLTVDYIELPLLLRFDIVRKRLRPYLQAGAFYATRVKATKTVEISSLDKASGAFDPLANPNPAIGASDLFIRSQWGLVGGLGLNYDLGNVRIGLDGFYKWGMNNITSEKNRYTDNRLSSTGDVLDGIKLRNIEVSLSVIFPMKFLETGFFRRVNPKLTSFLFDSLLPMKNTILLLLSFCLLLAACDIKDNKAEPNDSFFKIYENGDFDRLYLPLDVRQTADSGFVILGATNIANSNFYGLYLMKTDAQGRFLWEHSSQAYVNPLSGLLPSGKDLLVFCMNNGAPAPRSRLVRVDSVPQLLPGGPEVDFPLAAAAADDGFLLQSYDAGSQQTRLTRLNAGGGQVWSSTFAIFEDVTGRINDHLTRRSRPLPFFVGQTPSGQVYFNGFNNFTLSLTFAAPAGKQSGVLNGERYSGAAISSLLPLPNGRFATARYQGDGENVFIPQAQLNPAGIASAKDLSGNLLPELSKYARVVIQRATIDGKNAVLYGSDTKNGQMVIFAYDEASGSLLGAKYLGAGNTFEMGNFALTQDGGMVVVGRTFVAGRFSRLCLYKLSPQQVSALVSQVSQ